LTSSLELRSVGHVSSAGLLRRAFLFETIGITAQHWQEHGSAGDETGVRVEIQRLEEQRGAREYDAVELRLHDPIFRADLFALSTGAPGNFDHAHYHRFVGRDPGDRFFESSLTQDPLSWLTGKLSNLDDLFVEMGRPELRHPGDARRLADSAAEVVGAVGEMLAVVSSLSPASADHPRAS
jgi:hypothetical protein